MCEFNEGCCKGQAKVVLFWTVSAQMIISCFPANNDVSIHEGHGMRTIGWKDTGAGPSVRDAVNGEREETNMFPDPNPSSIRFGKETLMVNAAIMNGDRLSQPMNAPWIVELDLEESREI